MVDILRTKRSNDPSDVPANGTLQNGELAVNTSDAKLYVGNELTQTVELVGTAGPPGDDGADGADGAQGEQGNQGDVGPEGPSTPSADAGNLITIGSDSLLEVDPSTVSLPGHQHTLANDITDEGTMAYVDDAVSDGAIWGRLNAAWAKVAALIHTHVLADITDSKEMAAVDDAPNDGSQYTRKNLQWSLIESGPSAIYQETKPDELSYEEGQPWTRTSDMKRFELYVDTDTRQWVESAGCGINGADGQDITANTGTKNILINGDFRVNQRGGTKTPGVGVYGYDRWKGHALGLEQIVEEGNYAPNETYTLSNDVNAPSLEVAPASGNWSITVPATVTWVQLERGSIATPFEIRSIQQEVALCQRYYQYVPKLALFGYNFNNDANKEGIAEFATTMRVSPTVTVGSKQNWTSIGFDSSYKEGWLLRVYDSANGVTSANDILFDAEL